MSINITKDCSCICPSELKYSCDANGLCYQDDNGKYSSAEECLRASKGGYCGKFIRLSSNYLPWDAEPNFLIGELSVSNSNNTNIVYNLEDSSTFEDNTSFNIIDNKLYFTSFPNYLIQNKYNILVKAIIDSDIILLDILTIEITSDPNTYKVFIETGNNVTINNSQGISITFDSITSDGFLIIQNYTDYSVPVFDITTTASYAGNIQICATIPSGLDIHNTNLIHFNSGIFSNLPTTSIDESSRQICSIASSLSPFIIQTTGTPNPPLIPENVPTISLGDMESQIDDIFTTITSGGNSVQAIYNPDGSFSHLESQYIECPGNQTYTVQNIYSPLNGDCGCWETGLTLGTVISAIDTLATVFFTAKAIFTGISGSAKVISIIVGQLTEANARRELLEASIKFSQTIIKQLSDELARLNSQIASLLEDVNSIDDVLEVLAKQYDDLIPKAPDGTVILDDIPVEAEDIRRSMVELQIQRAEKQTNIDVFTDKTDILSRNIREETASIEDIKRNKETIGNNIELLKNQIITEKNNYTSLLAQATTAITTLYAAYEAFNNIPVYVVPKTCPEGQTLNDYTCECEIDYSDYSAI